MARILKRVLFFIAFTAYLLVQVILVGMIPAYWPTRVGVSLFFVGLFLSGTSGYVVLRRITRETYNRNEAEKWLALWKRPRVDISSRTMAVKRWAIWLPIATVMIVSLFFPETWAVVSHLSDRGSGRLLGYQVSIPVDWVIMMDEPDTAITTPGRSSRLFSPKVRSGQALLPTGGVNLLLPIWLFMEPRAVTLWPSSPRTTKSSRHVPCCWEKGRLL